MWELHHDQHNRRSPWSGVVSESVFKVAVLRFVVSGFFLAATASFFVSLRSSEAIRDFRQLTYMYVWWPFLLVHS